MDVYAGQYEGDGERTRYSLYQFSKSVFISIRRCRQSDRVELSVLVLAIFALSMSCNSAAKAKPLSCIRGCMLFEVSSHGWASHLPYARTDVL